jgi:hypothetical protein
MTVREADRRKKWLNCLRCGRRMYTDRCHRICRRCTIAIRRSQSHLSPSPLRVGLSSSHVASFSDADW